MPKGIKKSKEVLADKEPGTIFDHFALPNPKERDTEEDKAPKKADVASLEAQLKALTDRLDEQQRINTALMSATPVTSAHKAQAEPFKPTPIDTKDLPDPITDPDKYAAELSKRTVAAIRAEQEAFNKSQHQSSSEQAELDHKISALLEEFSEKYPALSENEDRVAFAAEKAAKAAKTKGLDIERYMFGPGREQYMRDVSKVYLDMWPVTEKEEKEESEEEGQRQGSRTSGVFGGQDSGGKPEGKQEPQKGDMIKDLRDMQRQSGLF